MSRVYRRTEEMSMKRARMPVGLSDQFTADERSGHICDYLGVAWTPEPTERERKKARRRKRRAAQKRVEAAKPIDLSDDMMN